MVWLLDNLLPLLLLPSLQHALITRQSLTSASTAISAAWFMVWLLDNLLPLLLLPCLQWFDYWTISYLYSYCHLCSSLITGKPLNSASTAISAVVWLLDNLLPLLLLLSLQWFDYWAISYLCFYCHLCSGLITGQSLTSASTAISVVVW